MGTRTRKKSNPAFCSDCYGNNPYGSQVVNPDVLAFQQLYKNRCGCEPSCTEFPSPGKGKCCDDPEHSGIYVEGCIEGDGTHCNPLRLKADCVSSGDCDCVTGCTVVVPGCCDYELQDIVFGQVCIEFLKEEYDFTEVVEGLRKITMLLTNSSSQIDVEYGFDFAESPIISRQTILEQLLTLFSSSGNLAVAEIVDNSFCITIVKPTSLSFNITLAVPVGEDCSTFYNISGTYIELINQCNPLNFPIYQFGCRFGTKFQIRANNTWIDVTEDSLEGSWVSNCDTRDITEWRILDEQNNLLYTDTIEPLSCEPDTVITKSLCDHIQALYQQQQSGSQSCEVSNCRYSVPTEDFEYLREFVVYLDSLQNNGDDAFNFTVGLNSGSGNIFEISTALDLSNTDNYAMFVDMVNAAVNQYKESPDYNPYSGFDIEVNTDNWSLTIRTNEFNYFELYVQSEDSRNYGLYSNEDFVDVDYNSYDDGGIYYQLWELSYSDNYELVVRYEDDSERVYRIANLDDLPIFNWSCGVLEYSLFNNSYLISEGELDSETQTSTETPCDILQNHEDRLTQVETIVDNPNLGTNIYNSDGESIDEIREARFRALRIDAYSQENIALRFYGESDENEGVRMTGDSNTDDGVRIRGYSNTRTGIQIEGSSNNIEDFDVELNPYNGRMRFYNVPVDDPVYVFGEDPSGKVVKKELLLGNIYTTDGTLTEDRVLDGDDKTLFFENLRSFAVEAQPQDDDQYGIAFGNIQTGEPSSLAGVLIGGKGKNQGVVISGLSRGDNGAGTSGVQITGENTEPSGDDIIVTPQNSRLRIQNVPTDTPVYSYGQNSEGRLIKFEVSDTEVSAVSQLTNDLGFQTSSQVSAAITAAKAVTCLGIDSAATALTGTVTQGVLGSILIPANSLSIHDIVEIEAFLKKVSPSANPTHRLYINNAISTSGATQIATSTGSTTTSVSKMERSFIVTSTGLTIFPASVNAAIDDAVNNTAQSDIVVDWTVNQYLIHAANNATGETTTNIFLYAKRSKA